MTHFSREVLKDIYFMLYNTTKPIYGGHREGREQGVGEVERESGEGGVKVRGGEGEWRVETEEGGEQAKHKLIGKFSRHNFVPGGDTLTLVHLKVHRQVARGGKETY